MATDLICCGKLTGIERVEMANGFLYVYACKECGKQWYYEPYNMTGDKVEVHGIQSKV